MRIGTLRRSRAQEAAPGVSGTVRLDRRTKNLTKRLRPGDVAVIDHVDIDRVSADSLVAAKVGAVVNAAASISGRYPNLGPEILTSAGIPLVDGVGKDVFGALKEGAQVRVEGNTLYGPDGAAVAQGTEQTPDTVAAAMADARAGLSTQLEAFATNTMEYMKRERALLLDGVGVPDVQTRIEGRHVLVVARGYDHRDDLVSLRHYIREFRPVLVGEDGGADALVEAGYTPDLIVGDLSTVTDEVLRGGAEVVMRADPDGRAAGLERVQDIGVDAVSFPSAGTSEDVALLLADAHGAELVVTVGTHATLLEFLDSGLQGTASTFLVRLKLGGRLVDAKSASRLHRSRISVWALLMLVFVTLVAVGVILALSADGRAWTAMVAGWWDDANDWAKGLLE